MKKILLSAVALVVAMNMNAQTESAFMNTEALGLGSEAVPVAAGTVMCSSTSIQMQAAYEDTYKAVAMAGESDASNQVVIAGTTYDMPTGAQGQTNPKENSLGTINADKTCTGGQTSGAVYKFTVAADGYLYVFGKLSSNKNYYAWEGPASAVAGTLVAYKVRGLLTSGAYNVNINLPANEMGYYVSGDEKYDNGTMMNQLEQIDANIGTKQNMLGVIAFPVYKEAGEYYVNACGSKITCNGFVFVPGATDIAEVSFTKGGGTGISTVKAAANNNAVVYNLAGQKVGADFKGIVVKNGVKMIQK